MGVAALGVEPTARRDATDACHVPVDRPPSELREWRVRIDAREPLAIGFLPLLILPVIAFLAAPSMPRWGFMWAMAFALYAGCKWLTYCEARVRGVASDRLRALGYLLAWPGMDATAFLGANRSPCPAAPIRVDSCRAQDVIRRDADLGRRPHRRRRSTRFWPAGSAWSA